MRMKESKIKYFAGILSTSFHSPALLLLVEEYNNVRKNNILWKGVNKTLNFINYLMLFINSELNYVIKRRRKKYAEIFGETKKL